MIGPENTGTEEEYYRIWGAARAAHVVCRRRRTAYEAHKSKVEYCRPYKALLIKFSWNRSLTIYDYESNMQLADSTYTRTQVADLVLTNSVKIHYKNLQSEVVNAVTFGLIVHTFVVFETKEYHWSVEKNDTGIFLQRSKQRSDVLEKICGQLRPGYGPVRLWSRFDSPVNDCTLYDVLNKVDIERQQPYHLTENNCQHFAISLYIVIAVPFGVINAQIAISDLNEMLQNV